MLYSNMGMTDRWFRIFAGFALMSQAFVGLNEPLFLFGFIPALMGVSGWCPVFSLVNWTSMSSDEIQEQLSKYKNESEVEHSSSHHRNSNTKNRAA